jgi:hypothetical protein
MSTIARLHVVAGLEVHDGGPYGTQAYGKIGYSMGVTPGFPLFQVREMVEVEDLVTAIIGDPYGYPAYGTITMRQARRPGPVESFRIESDGVFSPEFVEWPQLQPQLRLLDDETDTYEFSEVGWQD